MAPWLVHQVVTTVFLLFSLPAHIPQAQYQQSVTYFQRFFELARGLSDNSMLEAARFNLGVARGAVLMEVTHTCSPLCLLL